MPRKKRLHTITPKKKKKLLVEIDPTKSPGKDPFTYTEKHRRNDGAHPSKKKYNRRDQSWRTNMSASVDRVVSRYLSKTSADFKQEDYTREFFKDIHRELGRHRNISFGFPSASGIDGEDAMMLPVQLLDPKHGTVPWPDYYDDDAWEALEERMIKEVSSIRELRNFDYILHTYDIEKHHSINARLYIFGRK